ncbi:oxidoreductase activity, acting on NAD(P)H, oxygen as acceptor [Batrachochytrium dendrobatidis]|nr:oxidoreductase activity, acting on NAD(P)H, oxygen as acceptor [Batrachochytrium dendrobatidis]KAK5669828.1 oxidoreductase activity, acting on NAD(P)H, oxygen as acceptor [Batrachochytrium dendrobatidis]
MGSSQFSTKLILQGSAAIVAFIAFAFTLIIPSLERLGFISFRTTLFTVNLTDEYFLLFGLMPFSIIIVLLFLRNASTDDDAVRALGPSESSSDSNASPVLSSLWAPRWNYFARFSKLFAPWSTGDVVVGTALVLTHFVWFAQPVILRIYVYNAGKPFPSTVNLIRQLCNNAGMVGMWDAGLTIIFAVRENFATKAILGKEAGQYHRGIKYHIALGYASFFFITVHSIFYLSYFSSLNRLAVNVLPHLSNKGYMSFLGIISWIAFTLMVISSVFKARRYNYRIFYWTHQLFIVFLLFAFAHVFETLYPMVGPLIYFIFDRVMPRLKLERNTFAILTRVTPTIVRLDVPINGAFTKSSIYAPGDWVNILVPSISSLNWHPFSIASYHPTSSDTITIFVKSRGDWTNTLVETSTAAGSTVAIKIDGVFGSRNIEYLQYKHLVLIGAGTGMAALVPYLAHYIRATTGHITLIWSAKNVSDMCIYSELFELISNKSFKGRLTLHIHTTAPQQEYETIKSSIDDETTVSNSESTNESSVHSDNTTIKHGVIIVSATGSVDASAADRSNSGHLPFGYMTIALALLVFGASIGGYALGRLVLPDYSKATCSSRTSYLLTGSNHFMCWYYYYWAPMFFACLFAMVAGLTFTTCVTSLRIFVFGKSNQASKSNKPNHVHANCHPIRPIDFVRSCTPKIGRPQIETLLGEAFASSKDGAYGGSKIAVMAAGPERMLRTAEHFTMESGHTFYRESWKV